MEREQLIRAACDEFRVSHLADGFVNSPLTVHQVRSKLEGFASRRFPDRLGLQRRELRAPAREAVNVASRIVTMTFSTGAAVRRHRYEGWDSAIPFDEELVISREAVNLERLNSGAPALDSHSGWTTLSQVGVVERAWIEGRGQNAEARAEIRFPEPGTDESADRLFNLLQQGIVRNVSCGYSIDDVEVIPANPKRGTVERHRVLRWTPYEISFVTMGADARAQVREPPESSYQVTFTTRAEGPDEGSAAMERENRIRAICERFGCANRAAEYIAGTLTPEQIIEEQLTEAQRAAEATRQAEEQRQAEERRQAAIASERQRVLDITQAVADFGFAPTEATRFITGNNSIDQVRAVLQAQLAEQRRSQTPRTQGAPVTEPGTLEERTTRVRLMTNALAHKIRGNVPLEEGARQYRGMTALDMARECLDAVGISTRGMTREEIANLTFGGGQNLLALRAAGMHTTSDFPLVLGAQVNQSLRAAYEAAERTYRRIADRTNATDFRPIYRVNIGDAPELKLVNEHGEYKYGTVGDVREEFRVLTYGRIIAFTRQALINDQLDALERLPRSWGNSAAALENYLAWQLIIANGNMSDGNALFSTAHGNLAANPTAINVTGVGEARRAMRVQRGIDPNAPDGEQARLMAQIVGRILAVPAALEVAALQFISPVVVPTSDGTVNPLKNSLEILVEPLLDDDSALSWYLFVDPATGLAPLVYAYLDGNEGVSTDTRIGFEVDGMEFKARLDFGVGVQEYRGAYKNAGELASSEA